MIHPVASALLRRSGLVAPGLLATGRKIKDRGARSVPVDEGLVALEADVLSSGYLLSPGLRAYLAAQGPVQLTQTGLNLLSALEEMTGAGVAHVPLFRDFPRRIPANTYDLWIDRVFVLLLQHPQQPCVLCGKDSMVKAVSPCAHLICENCWDLGNYSGCPLCHRRIDPCCFLGVPSEPARNTKLPLPRRAVVLHLAEDVNSAVFGTIGKLLERQTPLTPQDRDDLRAMLNYTGHGALEWLPERIPVRETRAMILARLADDSQWRDRLPQIIAAQADTATDMLRLLYVLQGGDPGLTAAPPRRLSPRRWLRRLVLEFLESLAFPALVEDLHRHRAKWLSTVELLHPFEQAAHYPHAAAAFGVLRGTTVDEAHPFVATAAKYPRAVRFDGNRLHPLTVASRVESALDTGNLADALFALHPRPGDLTRRLVALASRTGTGTGTGTGNGNGTVIGTGSGAGTGVGSGAGMVGVAGVGASVSPAASADGDAADGDAVVSALREAVPSVSPGVLIAALGAVRAASWPAAPRLFLPKGGSALMWTQPDKRPRLTASLAAELEAVLANELLERAGRLPKVPVATVDGALKDLIAPFTDRSAAKALVRLPRGSSQPLPHGRRVRLFLHWTEPPGTRMDLDLSVAMFDEAGELAGWCDYTRLRFGGMAAVHSGDLTSAPAPLGASEFVDLDVAQLRKSGIRYLVMIVFSFNDVPFEAMTDAFAGFMGDPGKGEPFVPKAVEQRFDLTGNSKIATPLVVDLAQHRLRWLDAKLVPGGSGHSVARYSKTIGRLAVAAEEYFAGGRRVSLWELACWHAAARAGLVQVRNEDGSYASYLRGRAEPVADFAARLIALSPPDGLADTPEPASFAALVRGDVVLTGGAPGEGAPGEGALAKVALAERALSGGAQVYVLYPAAIDANAVELLDAADLVGLLAAQTSEPELAVERVSGRG